MAIYPKSDTDRRVSAVRLQPVVRAIFARCGMSDEDAALLAESLVHADLRGIHSHGVLRVPDYVKKLTREGVDPRGRPAVVSERGGAIIVDGGNSMGQIGGTFAMRRAIEKAREAGICLATVRGSNHCGALDWYTLMAAREDMIGLAGTNAIPTMAPWGGVRPGRRHQSAFDSGAGGEARRVRARFRVRRDRARQDQGLPPERQSAPRGMGV